MFPEGNLLSTFLVQRDEVTMPSRIRAFSALLLAAAVGGSPVASAASSASPAPKPRSAMTAREKVLHALNRLAFGPKPGDVERVLAMGVSTWIERQLDPETIPDAGLAGRLSALPTLAMSSQEIFDTYERPIRELRRERRAAAAASNPASTGTSMSMSAGASMSAAEAARADAEADALAEIRNRIPPEKRPRRVIEELSAARVVRAAYSERQLNEVLVDFWMNHFNVFAAKGLDRAFVTSFERDVIRPRIWGRFEDLLLATAKSPAMLFYLDNAQSVAAPENRPMRPFSGALRRAFGGGPERPGAALAANPRGGLNENYARELMELHPLGVDGGYTQKDVTELARVLTGWSIDRDRAEFVFRDRAHDVREKTVLGHRFPDGGGMEEGEAMISILARHPATARRIAYQLCQRFVADEPPAALVEHVAKRFLTTGGDLRQTVRAVVESPEFFAPGSYRAKVKSPFEYVVSAIRATGGETTAPPPVLRELAQMGEPLYLCQPPTGYSDASSAWVNSGSLVARLNFAIALAANRLPGTSVDLAAFVEPGDASDSCRSVDALARALVGGELSKETRTAIEKRLAERAASGEDVSSASEIPLVAGLILGSPEFQRQ